MNLGDLIEYLDTNIVITVSELSKLLAIFLSLVLIGSIIIRYCMHLIIREVKIIFIQRSKFFSKPNYEPTNKEVEDLEDYSVALNVYVMEDDEDEFNRLRIDRGMKENIPEGEEDVTLGKKQYVVDIKQVPQDNYELDEKERRRELEFQRFMKDLSDNEKEDIKDKLGDLVTEADLISYQELYLVFKGIEKEYRNKMIQRLNNLDRNFVRLKSRIERSGVSEKNSIIYINRFVMLRREVEVYKRIIEHKSLIRKLVEIETYLQKLSNDYPFLIKGYNKDTKPKVKRNPIDRGGMSW